MSAERLSDALIALRALTRLSQDDLHEISGVARGTIKAIEGGAKQPRPETLARLARGLATDRYGEVNEARSAQNYRRLMVAAGYLIDEQPVAQQVRIGLRGELETIFRRSDDAAIVEEIVTDLAADDPDDRRVILQALRTLVRRKTE